MPLSARQHSLPLLDGVRALAAVLVVVTHVAFQTGAVTSGAVGAVLARCDVGVAVFFVLSGFLLTRPWTPRPDGLVTEPNLRTYAVRRAARILPAYWLVLAVVLLTTARDSSPAAMAANVTLTQVYTGDLLAGYTQTWSLCTEVAFYLALPLLAPWVCRRVVNARGALLVGLISAGITFTWIALSASEVLPRRAGQWFPGHLDWFTAGILLACADAARRRRPAGLFARLHRELADQPVGLLAVVGTTFWLAATPLAGPRTLFPATPLEALAKEVLYCIIGLGLVLWGLTAEGTSGVSARLLGNRFSQVVGTLSYGLFLWHLVVMAGIFTIFDVRLFSGGLLWILPLTLAISLLLAWGSWVTLEQPLLRRAHRPAGEVVPVTGPSPPH